MTASHLLNLVIHVGAGILGIALGAMQLWRAKGDAGHRRLGRWFVFAVLIVTGSALVGTIAFRFLPLFAVLTVLVTYVAVGGWRVARTRAAGPAPVDLLWTLVGLAMGAGLLPALFEAAPAGNSRPVVVGSTLGGLALVLAYDLVKWAFPRRWFARLWLPEHIYKVLSALFGMVSAFAGNVLTWGQPWSQLAPSAAGTLLIIYWWWRTAPAARLRT